ncbi:MAG: hypothetical protein GYB67_08240 [Chloroflexi bacterium]|nr:hypothetical protein [Chloroflexota bacterium]
MTDAAHSDMGTAVPLRQLTDAGIERFRAYLLAAQAGATDPLPDDLLNDNQFARLLDANITVEARMFATALEMAAYLHPRIEALRLPGKYYDPGLWAWLTAFYLNSVLPPNDDGRRKVGELARYIPPTDRNWRGNNRHLMAIPVRIYSAHATNDDSVVRLFLYPPPHERASALKEIIESQELMANRSIFEALTILYWDEAKRRPKRGAATRGKPGTLRRFVAVMNQFNRTFDLFAMSGEQIVELLPKAEFGRWLE